MHWPLHCVYILLKTGFSLCMFPKKTLSPTVPEVEEGTTEGEMVGWHPLLNGREFEQTPGDSEGQGSLACCSPWGCKESDMAEQLNSSS